MSSAIEVCEGRFVDPLNLKLENIRIEDIAHSLAQKARFGGFAKRILSVAEHSVNVAKTVRRMAAASIYPEHVQRRIVRQALLHDSPEYLIGDMVTPLKHSGRYDNFNADEGLIWGVVCERFDIDVSMHPFVKEADRRMCSTEKLAIMSDVVTEWEWGSYMRKNPPYVGDWNIVESWPEEFEPSWRQMKRRFLDFWQNVKPQEA